MKKIVLFIMACFSLFLCVNGINEDEVLDAFTDVYDMMYDIRDTQNMKIKKLEENEIARNKEMELLKVS